MTDKRPAADDFQIDSEGRLRRLCDFPASPNAYKRKGGLCNAYAAGQAPDGRATCRLHDPSRGDRCTHPIAHDADGRPVRYCSRTRKYYVRQERRWFCRQHDPLRPRCSNDLVHPPEATPRGHRTKGGAYLCAACLEAFTAPAVPACNLCGRSGFLEVNRRKRVPCVCRPEGRELVNGAPDAVVLAVLAGDRPRLVTATTVIG